MYESYLLEIISLLVRWLHVIVGIAWIGSSFYFVWLDNSIIPPVDEELKEKGVLGELWAMHAGGFYNPQKYVVAPKTLPDRLFFFFWPSYSTWLTGITLMTAIYYARPQEYMIDPSKIALSSATAVCIGLGTLLCGWLVYDGLARLLIERSLWAFAILYTTFVGLVAWTLCTYLSGRAAFIHVGAMIATAMSGNVFFIIIPAQRKIVAAMKRGEVPDAKPGKRAKQRSVHNNYLTLPVLLAMLSNHYAFLYNRPTAPLVLMGLMIGSVPIRHFFNLKHKGVYAWHMWIIGGACIFTVFAALTPYAPAEVPIPPGPPATFAEVQTIINARCIACHSQHPTLASAAPAGVMLDTPERIQQNVSRIWTQVAVLRAMPLGNATGMQDLERGKVASWIKAGAKSDK